MGEEDRRNPISDGFRAIVGFLITPFALVVLGGSNLLHSISGWDSGLCYAVVFVSPIAAFILIVLGRKVLHAWRRK